MTVKNKDREHLMSEENPAWEGLYFLVEQQVCGKEGL